MAISSRSLLSAEPTNIVRQPVTIGHIQLRDVVICPEERGIVDYVYGHSIMERDITNPMSPITTLANLDFKPNTIASLNIPDSDERILAAGGQEAELHLSVHRQHAAAGDDTKPSSSSSGTHYNNMLNGSINNSVLLTSLNLTRSHESSVESRLVVSNNDCTVKFYDIALPRQPEAAPRINEAGALKMTMPINHSSISPDGRALLSVGDSPHVYLHAIAGGASLTFSPLMKLDLPELPYSAPVSATGPASFSTAFSATGVKFAVASQEGMVVVWDVRSTKPLKVYQTDRTRVPKGCWYDNSWDWGYASIPAPGWGVRNVKFSPAGHGGKEIMTFTEHTSLLHVVDASTFEEDEVIRVPSLVGEGAPSSHSSSADGWTTRIPHLTDSPPLPPPPSAPLRVYSTTTFDYARHGATISRARAAQIRLQRSRGTLDDEYEADAPIVVRMPILGDRHAEHDVRRVLGRHGVYAIPPSEDVMEVDEHEYEPEPEPDCGISRTSSPAPISAPPAVTAVSWRRRPVPGLRAQAERGGPWKLVVKPDLDLAGTCFDPTGRHVYVASEDGIVEWAVRGAEKTWWSGSAWA